MISRSQLVVKLLGPSSTLRKSIQVLPGPHFLCVDVRSMHSFISMPYNSSWHDGEQTKGKFTLTFTSLQS
jgi:hypothetical protein